MRTITTINVFALSMLLAACGSDRGPDEFGYWDSDVGSEQPFEDAWSSDDYSQELTLVDSHLTGRLGDVQVDHDGTEFVGWNDSYWASLQIVVQTANSGSAMVILEMSGGLDHADYQPGNTQTYTFDHGWLGEGDSHVTIIGCSGERPYEWEWDQPADEVELTVEQDPVAPDVLNYGYTARFVDYSGIERIVNGSVSVRR